MEDSITTLMWTLSLLVAYPLVVLAFHIDPLGRRLHPWMRCGAIAFSTVFLTTRIIRIEMADTREGHSLLDSPLPLAATITIFFGVLAATGAPSLIAAATMLIASDMAWILDRMSARAAL